MNHCPKCNSPANPDDQFCRECGARLDTGAGSDPRAVARALRQARRAHRRGDWELARSGYESVIQDAPGTRKAANARRGLALVDVQRRPGGQLGFWALGLLAAPAVLLMLVTLLPPRVEVVLSVLVVSISTLSGLVGGLLALVAVVGQRGTWNKLSGAAALGIVAYLLFTTGQMDRVKEQRFLISQGIAAAARMRLAVEDAYTQTGRFPDSEREAPAAPPSMPPIDGVDAITLGAGGVVTVFFAAGTPGPFAGKTVVYEPSPAADGRVNWSCHKGTVPHELRPPACRKAP